MESESSINKITLPKLSYQMNNEPEEITSINTYGYKKYLQFIEERASLNVLKRINSSFLYPCLLTVDRDFQLSAKSVYFFLTRCLITKKENELWFYFNGTPMRFSIREFHQITGLKCKADEHLLTNASEDSGFNWSDLDGKHTLETVKNKLEELLKKEDAEDEQYALSMLYLIEGYLHSNYTTRFLSVENVKRAKCLHVLENYPWGLDSYNVLLKSLKKAVNKKPGDKKCSLLGLPIVFHIWILESIPKLQAYYSDLWNKPTRFLCEKYVALHTMELRVIKIIESIDKPIVHTFLKPLDFDADNDSLSLNDNPDDDLDQLVDLVKQGYRITSQDWERGFIDIAKAKECISKMSSSIITFETNEKAAVYDLINQKIEAMKEMAKKNFALMRQRFSNVENQLELLTDNWNSSVNQSGDDVSKRRTVSPFRRSTSHPSPKENPGNRESTTVKGIYDILFPKACIEILNDGFWYSGSVISVGEKDDDGNVLIKVEYKKNKMQESVELSRLRPTSQTVSSDGKELSLLTKVEFLNATSWEPGKIKAILDKGKYLVSSDLRMNELQCEDNFIRLRKDWNWDLLKWSEPIIFSPSSNIPVEKEKEKRKRNDQEKLDQEGMKKKKEKYKEGVVYKRKKRNLKDPRDPTVTELFRRQKEKATKELGEVAKEIFTEVNPAVEETVPQVNTTANAIVPEDNTANEEMFVEAKQSTRENEEQGTSVSTGVVPRCSCTDQKTKKLVVFDLNGILADIVFQDQKTRILRKADHVINMRLIFKRPHLDSFLDFCFERFEVGIWSSRTLKSGLVFMKDEILGWKHNGKHLFLFGHCTKTDFMTLENKYKPLFLKDLKKVWEHHGKCRTCHLQKYDETNTLLIDDSPGKAVLNSPYNCIFPPTYKYENVFDSQLAAVDGDLKKYLENLDNECSNVQIYMKEKPFQYGSCAITPEHKDWGFYSQVIEAEKKKQQL